MWLKPTEMAGRLVKRFAALQLWFGGMPCGYKYSDALQLNDRPAAGQVDRI